MTYKYPMAGDVAAKLTTRLKANPTKNPYEVHSASGLEGMFADRDDADALADELKRAGAKGVQVKGPQVRLRLTRFPGSPPMHHAPRGRPPGVPNPQRKNPEIGDVRVGGRILRGTSQLEIEFQVAADLREMGRNEEADKVLRDQVGFWPIAIIYKGMARSLWVTSYADYIEKELDDLPARSGDRFENLREIVRSARNGWENVAPDTPQSADWAAEDLAVLVERANNASTGDERVTLEGLYHRAVEADAKVAKAPFVPDEDYAELFGHYLAMQALGHGVTWFDDHAKFPIRIPSFEAYMLNGFDLGWSPQVIRRGEARSFAPSADEPEDDEPADDEGMPDGDSLGGARGLPAKNPTEGTMWRVWITSYPDSYTDVMARSALESMSRGALAFKAQHKGEIVELNTRKFGEKHHTSKLARLARDGRIDFT